MKVKIVPIVISAFGTVTEGSLKGLEDLEVGRRVGTIKWQHFWERPESWDESWRLEETCCHSNSSEKPSANTDVKNSKGVNNNNMKDLEIESEKMWHLKTAGEVWTNINDVLQEIPIHEHTSGGWQAKNLMRTPLDAF